MSEGSQKSVTIDRVIVDAEGRSIFDKVEHPLTDRTGMFISERQTALNFRHRISEPGYEADWHTAGDPTLLIILSGKLVIELRNGDSKTFVAGQQFIAADYEMENVHDKSIIGHRARVEGDVQLQAVHVKLEQR